MLESITDNEAFDKLYQQYAPKVLRYTLRRSRNYEDAEEAVHYAFVDYIEKFPDLTTQNPQAWLCIVARNKLIDKYKRDSYAKNTVSFDVNFEEQETVHAPIDSLIENERANVLHAMLLELPDRQQQMLYQRYWLGKGIADIAEELAATKSAVKSCLHKTRRQIQEKLQLRYSDDFSDG